MPINPRLPPALPRRGSATETNDVTTGATENMASSSRRTLGSSVLAMLPGLRSTETPEQQRTRQALSAARVGNIAVLQALLTEHPDLLLATDKDNNSLLNTAALYGKETSLLSVIHFAWQPEHQGAWAALLNHTNKNGETALWQAVNGGHKAIVRALVKHAETDLSRANAQGRTPLYQAVYRGDSAIVAELVSDARAQPNLPDHEGNTPLMVATRYEYVDIVSALIKRTDILPNLTNLSHKTALSMAVDGHKQAILTELLKSPSISVNDPDKQGKTPVWQLTTTLVEHMAIEGWRESYYTELNTLRILLKSGKADFNYINHVGETPLTYLCKQEPRFEGEGYHRRFLQARFALVEEILVGSATLANPHVVNPSVKNIDGASPLRIAFNQGNAALTRLLFQDKRTDKNCMAATLINQTGDMHDVMFPNGPSLDVTNSQLKNEFIIKALQDWVLFRQPDGKSSADAGRSHFELSKLKYPLMTKMIKEGRANLDCRPGTAMKHAQLGLELLLVGGNLSFLPIYAKQALICSPEHRVFNLSGVNVPRRELENWASGQLPERMIMAQMEQNLRQFNGVANVHQDGFTARGRVILTTIQERIKTAQSSLVSFDEAKSAILAVAKHDLELASAMPDTDPAAKQKQLDRVKLVTDGVAHAELQTEPVHEGLNTNTHDTLRTMWSYIQMQPGESKEHLITSLFTRLADIGEEQVCNTGCVQRILYCVEGVDASMVSQAPTPDVIKDEIRGILGQVNNYFEDNYQYSMDLSEDGASSSTATHRLTASQQRLVESYQHGGINEEHLLQVKQDIAKVSVLDDLVARRGWDHATVETLLQPELDNMKYI